MKNLLRLQAIVGALPVTLTNGTTADATQVMSDLNWLVNQVNANAAPLANTALLNANNNFTVAQSGTAASAPANFPIASQVQNQVFNTLASTLGTNLLTARCAALPLTAFATGQVFRFVPSQTNTGPSSLTIDAAGSSIIFSGGATLIGGEMKAGVPAAVMHDGSKLNMLGPFVGGFIPDAVTLGNGIFLNVLSSVLSQYIQGSFTATATGMSGSVTGTAFYTIIGNTITLDLPFLSGTSNATTFTITGAPATIWPGTRKFPFARTQDNGGAFQAANCQLETSGVVSLFKDENGTAFTASGTKGATVAPFTYTNN